MTPNELEKLCELKKQRDQLLSLQKRIVQKSSWNVILRSTSVDIEINLSPISGMLDDRVKQEIDAFLAESLERIEEQFKKIHLTGLDD